MKCCFCKKEIVGYGNNPAPLKSNKERCCDSCNFNIVVPVRMKSVIMKSFRMNVRGDYKEK